MQNNTQKTEDAKISVDSLKLRIPFHRVKVVSPTLNKYKFIVDEDTGELERRFKETSLGIKKTGISTYYQIQNINFDKDEKEECLCIMFNSKILKSRYFEGITSDNINHVYDELIAQGIALFSKEDFLNGLVTDCDFKLDFSYDDFDLLIKVLFAQTKEHRQRDRGAKKYNKKDNKGIQWSDRRKGTPSNPYLKFYSKSIELFTKSIEFYNSYIKGTDIDSFIDDIIRLEFTIKNKQHFRKLGIESNHLSTVLGLSQTKLDEVRQSIVDIHLNKRTLKKKIIRNDVSPLEIIIITAIRTGLKLGSYSTVRENYLSALEGERTIRRYGKKFDSLYNEFIKGGKEDEVGNTIESVFNIIGI